MVEEDFYSDPLIAMEHILDSLKMLDYETKFCRNKGFKPISKFHFAIASNNASE